MLNPPAPCRDPTAWGGLRAGPASPCGWPAAETTWVRRSPISSCSVPSPGRHDRGPAGLGARADRWESEFRRPGPFEGTPLRNAILLIAVFFAGMSGLGLEVTASPLLGNVYGTSNIVWGNIIGLMLVYLTAGSFLGGRWADRSPSPRTFYRIIAWAAFTAGLVPLVARPVLREAAGAVESLDAAVMAGAVPSPLFPLSVPPA